LRAPQAAELLYGVVKDAGATDLASVASQLLLLPKPQAVALLTRALTSPSGDDQATACQALSRLDSGDARQALADATASIPPGTPAWIACTVARARLNDPDSTWKLGGLSSYLEGDALLEAADAMAAVGDNEAALDAVRKVVRQGRPPQQLSAAARLATLDRDAARGIVDVKLGDRDPVIRARALQVERLLERPPSSVVRAQLADQNESVRLRAAEAVLDWAARVAKGAPAGGDP
jgi:HEAT repeat protein